MKLRFGVDCMVSLMVLLLLFQTLVCPRAWGGLLRVNMNDGSFIEVPYFWEENGEIKFEFAGGVAGIPKGQVASVQEVLATKEFDPEVLLEVPKEDAEQGNKKLQDFLTKQIPSLPNYEKLDPAQSLQILQSESLTKKGAKAPSEALLGPLFNLETDFAELVRIRGDGILLVMQNVLSSRADLRNQSFTLVVYDAEGNVLQRKPCEIHEIAIDRKAQKNLEFTGHLFSVIATIKPDPKIKRFEIVSARR